MKVISTTSALMKLSTNDSHDIYAWIKQDQETYSVERFTALL